MSTRSASLLPPRRPCSCAASSASTCSPCSREALRSGATISKNASAVCIHSVLRRSSSKVKCCSSSLVNETSMASAFCENCELSCAQMRSWASAPNLDDSWESFVLAALAR